MKRYLLPDNRIMTVSCDSTVRIGNNSACVEPWLLRALTAHAKEIVFLSRCQRLYVTKDGEVYHADGHSKLCDALGEQYAWLLRNQYPMPHKVLPREIFFCTTEPFATIRWRIWVFEGGTAYEFQAQNVAEVNPRWVASALMDQRPEIAELVAAYVGLYVGLVLGQ